MFLKRIEMQGFKSFADRTVIDFENPVTGVVGPNGCGKSNISDAVRWVLGEQSAKSLRGDKMTDVIFAGSESRKAVAMAEVTLVFDNTKHQLNSESEEIELTRRIYNAEDQEAEYLINRQNVRYKDVIDLILDSGLGKDSLSMISQGNISAFAEAKPYDRRAIFEDAAGVAKYKKRKVESLAKLERTKENLDRTFDILNELERQVSPLKRQSKKALIYREKKQRLQEIEIAVLVDDIKNLNAQKQENAKSLFDLESSLAMHQTTIQVNENSNAESRANLKEYDKTINHLQDQLVNCLNEIKILETQKVEVDERRKYAIEMGSSQQKIDELKSILDNAKFEYEDRLNRLNTFNNDMQLLNKNLEELSISLADASLKKEETTSVLNRLTNRIEVLENLLKDPFASSSHSGVKAIMDSKDAFYGIMGVVGQELKPHETFEYAISAALSNSTYHIIVKDEEAARKAISFLKKNESGRATFLPITVLKNHEIKYEDEVVCKNTPGYLGVAGDFVTCSEEFDIVADCLLNNIIVVDNLENANNLAALLKYNYKVVTLEGDIVHKGGSISGGKVKNETSIVTAMSELERCKESFVSLQAENELAIKAYNELINQKAKLDSELTEKRINVAQLEPLVEVKRAKYESVKADYEMIAPKDGQDDATFEDEIVKKLAEFYNKKDELSTSLKVKRDERVKLSQEIDRRDQQLRQMRSQTDIDNQAILKVTGEKGSIEAKLENNLNRLASEYQMTYEYAVSNNTVELSGGEKEEVQQLRREIEALGNVNMAAPEEFDQVNERYEFLKANYDDLIASRNKILDAIDEMDQIMKVQFKETFDAINAQLNSTLKVLFNGAKGRLILEDENDILNTGIDIDIQPPGKSVKSIRLFSGGEKTLIAMCVLFTILKVKPTPLIIFDEVEAALDQANVERFAKYVKEFSNDSQFIIITHRPGTMEQCDVLFGITMQNRGVSQLLKVKLVDAIEMADDTPETNNVEV
ncbi:MAG: AAA family ATPase [Erysipelotrichaceae bacterium]|nr:AAA family ATPase [Erysipelotrichaceae bacterium]